MKRVAVISDLHCGHFAGLTPRRYQNRYSPYSDVQAALWDFYERTLFSLKKIDVLLVLGDAIDGKGDRSGGTEQTHSSLMKQCEIAVECIKTVKAKKVIMVYGTPYHVNGRDGEDYEGLIAREVGAEIGGHLWVDVNGLIFDLKHKVGSSGIPHGRSTAIKKEALWNLLWAEKKANPKSDVILRGHVHYFDYTGNSQYLAMTLPALQGPGSTYGVRQCPGVVDFGMVSFDVKSREDYSWQWHLLNVVVPVEAIKL